MLGLEGEHHGMGQILFTYQLILGRRLPVERVVINLNLFDSVADILEGSLLIDLILEELSRLVLIRRLVL